MRTVFYKYLSLFCLFINFIFLIHYVFVSIYGQQLYDYTTYYACLPLFLPWMTGMVLYIAGKYRLVIFTSLFFSLVYLLFVYIVSQI